MSTDDQKPTSELHGMARSVAWDAGDPIPRTPFRHLIRAGDTDGRFSAQSAVLRPHELVIPHSHKYEDEFTFVFRGRIGGRVGDQDLVVDEGGFLFKPRGVVHAMWNQTDVEAIVLEFISPAGFEGFFEEMGALQEGVLPDTIREIASRYGQIPHPELIAELSELYGVSM
jgi:quercetin dioxygenase-like cupin family protein